jgi:hypothetical protein
MKGVVRVLPAIVVAADPVEGAEITVAGGMPQHEHGLPTASEVTEELGSGDYVVAGLRFRIAAAGESDRVTFNLILE